MGGLLRLVQRGGARAGCDPAQSPPHCTICNSPLINGQCTNFILSALTLPLHYKGLISLLTCKMLVNLVQICAIQIIALESHPCFSTRSSSVGAFYRLVHINAKRARTLVSKD